MMGKLRKSKLSCPESNCLSHHQVASETIHGANLALKQVNCDVCIEENEVCKCDNSGIKGMVKTEDVNQQSGANSSFLHAVLNMSGMLIGLGQLSTPYALENGGWASVLLLVGLGVICTYSSHLLGKCLERNPQSQSYADIGENAFGRKGRVLAATFIYLEIFMALVSYTISLNDNLITVFSGTELKLPGVKLSTSQLITMIAVLIALPSLWLRDLSSISFLSSGGILMSLIIFTSVVCTAIFGGVKPNHRIPVLHMKNIPAISGLYIFSYAGHIVFPNLYKAMKDPSQFTKVSIVSFASVTALYTALAFMGAKLFGPQVNPQITLSLPQHHFVTKIALWSTVLTPMTKYALEFAPFAIQLEHNLPDSLSCRMKLIIRGCVGSFLLLLILALALSVPYFEHMLSLTGSLVSICICLILPCAFYIKLSWPLISRRLLTLNLSLIAFGSLLGVLGTISSAKLLIKSLLTAHST
ncbi:amino acid transporter AVT1H-like [Durio zibethinus]|uniref:Amino acid transporter AVT1H-like n=1 Tax=Durio zibethinus TaxID=66656 RepID=A0A6P6A8G4_DURZI|nr:amino acid transporter AVT1H-like [Durio zibethinus]